MPTSAGLWACWCCNCTTDQQKPGRKSTVQCFSCCFSVALCGYIWTQSKYTLYCLEDTVWLVHILIFSHLVVLFIINNVFYRHYYFSVCVSVSLSVTQLPSILLHVCARSLFLPPAVCKSILEPVTKEILLEYVDRCSQAVQAQNRKHPPDPDSELMPPPPPKRPNRAIP